MAFHGLVIALCIQQRLGPTLLILISRSHASAWQRESNNYAMKKTSLNDNNKLKTGEQ